MIQSIVLEHFKCFERLSLPLARLTLLTGLNAAGKSTVMQALALLHQTLNENPNGDALVLNGRDVALGSADELIDKLSGREHFAIGVEHESGQALWRMRAEVGALVAPFLDKPAELPEVLKSTLQTITYISADRIGPRETYLASSSAQQSGVGARGEYTPWFIYEYAELRLHPLMCREGAPPTLQRQVEAWLAFFFPGSGLEINPIPRTNLLTMRLRTSSATDFYRTANVGYGMSHVLPVIAACLGAVAMAQRDNRVAPLVMVENPELHLHPAGQSAMGVFLAQAAAAGAQMIVETHSDHVLNGLRRAVKGVGGNPVLKPDQAAIHFFQLRDDTGTRPQIISPRIDHQGNLDVWPPDFFDQYEKDLGSLIGW